jgi:hypothetical protein
MSSSATAYAASASATQGLFAAIEAEQARRGNLEPRLPRRFAD